MRERPEPERNQLLEAVPRELRATLRSFGLMGWAPAEVHMQVCEIIYVRLGHALALRFWRDYYLKAFDLALLKPLVFSARRIYGNEPHSYIRQAPKIYGLVTRNAGTLEVTPVDDHKARIELRQLATPFRRSAALAESLAGTCAACVHHTGRGDARIDREYGRLAEGVAAFEVTWT